MDYSQDTRLSSAHAAQLRRFAEKYGAVIVPAHSGDDALRSDGVKGVLLTTALKEAFGKSDITIRLPWPGISLDGAQVLYTISKEELPGKINGMFTQKWFGGAYHFRESLMTPEDSAELSAIMAEYRRRWQL